MAKHETYRIEIFADYYVKPYVPVEFSSMRKSFAYGAWAAIRGIYQTEAIYKLIRDSDNKVIEKHVPGKVGYNRD